MVDVVDRDRRLRSTVAVIDWKSFGVWNPPASSRLIVRRALSPD